MTSLVAPPVLSLAEWPILQLLSKYFKAFLMRVNHSLFTALIDRHNSNYSTAYSRLCRAICLFVRVSVDGHACNNSVFVEIFAESAFAQICKMCFDINRAQKRQLLIRDCSVKVCKNGTK
jgi:hypothetical protein